MDSLPEIEDQEEREEGEYAPTTTSATSKSLFALPLALLHDDNATAANLPWEKVGARYFRAIFQRPDCTLFVCFYIYIILLTSNIL